MHFSLNVSQTFKIILSLRRKKIIYYFTVRLSVRLLHEVFLWFELFKVAVITHYLLQQHFNDYLFSKSSSSMIFCSINYDEKINYCRTALIFNRKREREREKERENARFRQSIPFSLSQTKGDRSQTGLH